MIEHNPEVIKSADWIIDLGPEGGDEGGRIVAEGTPETIAATAGSATGEYLARVLRGEPLVRSATSPLRTRPGGRALVSRPPRFLQRRPRRRASGSPRRGPRASAERTPDRVWRMTTRDGEPAGLPSHPCPRSTSPSWRTRRRRPARPEVPRARRRDRADRRAHGSRCATPHLALVVGLVVTAPETEREHELRFVLLGPGRGGGRRGHREPRGARPARTGGTRSLTFSDRPLEPDVPGARRLLVPDRGQRVGAQAPRAPRAGPVGRRRRGEGRNDGAATSGWLTPERVTEGRRGSAGSEVGR